MFCDNPPAATEDASAIWPPGSRPSTPLPPGPGETARNLSKLFKKETRREQRIASIVSGVFVALVILYTLFDLGLCGR